MLGLTAGLHARGHDVRVFATLDRSDAGEAYHQALRAAGVPVVPIVAPGRRYLAEARSIRSGLREMRAEVAHTHGYRSDVVGGHAARRTRVPVVSTVHGFTGGAAKGRFFEWLQVKSLARADLVVAVSDSVAHRLSVQGVPARNLLRVRNARRGSASMERGAAQRLLGLDPRGVHLAWVGRLSREKGADVLVEALGRIRDLPWHVGFIGDGPERTRLEARAHALGLADRITWHGVVAGAGSLLAAFDLVVLSSRTEGTPMILLEAMGAGVPVVATAVGGVPDVVTDAEAILVPAESPEDLAGALRTALGDLPALAPRVAASVRRLESFAYEPWLDAYEGLYHRLVRGPIPEGVRA